MKATRLERIDDCMFTILDRKDQAQMVGGQTTVIGTGPISDPIKGGHGDRADMETDTD
ncbi:MAG TPA: hypothetical protein VI756_22285 [Blastocatellia bacterium]